MAKAKKKETLSLEEKLEQALVPVDEQPYEVPENWCWVTVGNIVDLHRGVSYKKNEGHSVKEENDCLVMRGGNILEGAIDVEADNIYVDKSLIKTEQYVRENDIIIVSSTGSTKVIGRAGISYADYDDVSFGAFLTLVRPKEQINKRYVDYYFQSQIYRERIRSLASGVNINNIRTEYITNSPIPLPPLAEQQRIVEQIENLFAKLDEAKEKAQYALESFEIRKRSILYKAFVGNYSQGADISEAEYLFSEITRVKDDMISKKLIQKAKVIPVQDCDMKMEFPDRWKQVKLGEIAFVTKLAGFEYTKYFNLEESGEVPVIRAQNVRRGYLDTRNLLYIDRETSESLQRSALNKPSILVTFIGAGIGDVCVFDEKTRFHLAPNVAKVEPYVDEST